MKRMGALVVALNLFGILECQAQDPALLKLLDSLPAKSGFGADLKYRIGPFPKAPKYYEVPAQFTAAKGGEQVFVIREGKMEMKKATAPSKLTYDNAFKEHIGNWGLQLWNVLPGREMWEKLSIKKTEKEILDFALRFSKQNPDYELYVPTLSFYFIDLDLDGKEDIALHIGEGATSIMYLYISLGDSLKVLNVPGLTKDAQRVKNGLMLYTRWGGEDASFEHCTDIKLLVKDSGGIQVIKQRLYVSIGLEPPSSLSIDIPFVLSEDAKLIYNSGSSFEDYGKGSAGYALAMKDKQYFVVMLNNLGTTGSFGRFVNNRKEGKGRTLYSLGWMPEDKMVFNK